MNQLVQTSPTRDDCNIAMLAHLLGIFTGFVGALIIWLIKKDDSAFIREQAAEALNFQITVAIAMLVAGMLVMVLVGFLLMPAIAIINVIFCIFGALAASKGQTYRYPFALRLVR
jgi:uncharacterized protein